MKIIWQAEKVISLVTFIMIILGIIISSRIVVGLIAVFCLVIAFCGGYISNRYQILAGHIYSFYIILVGPIELVFSMLSPEMLIADRLNTYYGSWLFEQTDLILEYALYMMVFYLTSMIVLLFLRAIGSKSIKKRFKINFNYIFRFNPYVFAVFLVLLEYFLRTKYNLNVPGKNPSISYAGIIVYLMAGLNIFTLASIVYINVLESQLYIKNILKILFGIIIVSLPSILVGQRGKLVFIFIVVLTFIIIVKQDSLGDIIVKRKFSVATIFVTVFVLLGSSNIVRTGVFDPVGFLIERITALYDGTTILFYLRDNEVTLSLINFFELILTGSGLTPNSIYTYVIQGYPISAIHANSSPIFIASLFYNNILGIIVISIIYSLIMGIFSNSIIQKIKEKGFEKQEFRYMISVFCCIYILLNTLVVRIFEGDITSFKSYVIPLIAYSLSYILRPKFKRIRKFRIKY